MIPDFDISGVLPPYLAGEQPTRAAAMCPYRTNVLEVVQRLGTSPARRTILEGFLRYRRELARSGFANGFQWLDGSFVENIELLENRDPLDIDVITFFVRPEHARDDHRWRAHWPDVQSLFDRKHTKPTFKVDAFLVDMNEPPELVVNGTRYWFGLFTHRRVTKQWKGMLQIPLQLGKEDDEAWTLLTGRAAP